jgi:hypothetical protein
MCSNGLVLKLQNYDYPNKRGDGLVGQVRIMPEIIFAKIIQKRNEFSEFGPL